MDFNFLGFQFPNSVKQKITSEYKETFPDDKLMVNTDNWAILENKNNLIFASMYNAVIQKKS